MSDPNIFEDRQGWRLRLPEADAVLKRMKALLPALVLGGLIMTPTSAAQDRETDALRARAEQGDAAAQSSLGWRYHIGSGVPKNPVEARKWMRMAAEQGHGAARINLCSSWFGSLNVADNGDPYEHDQDPKTPIGKLAGSKADVEDALKWCRLAASGDKPAQYRLGVLYAKASKDRKPDYAASYFWLSLKKTEDVFRNKVASKLSAKQRAEIEARARQWKPGQDIP